MPLKTLPLEEPTLNLTPMVDVVFNLLLFFMIASQGGGSEQVLDVEVPQVVAGGALTDAPQRQVIEVTRRGEIALNGERLTLAELSARLYQMVREYPETSLVVHADRAGLVQHLADVLSVCHLTGVDDVRIAVRTQLPDE